MKPFNLKSSINIFNSLSEAEKGSFLPYFIELVDNTQKIVFYDCDITNNMLTSKGFPFSLCFVKYFFHSLEPG